MKSVFILAGGKIMLAVQALRDENEPRRDAYGSPLPPPLALDGHIEALLALYDALMEEGKAASYRSKRSWLLRASLVDPANSAWSKIRDTRQDGATVLVRHCAHVCCLLSLFRMPIHST